MSLTQTSVSILYESKGGRVKKSNLIEQLEEAGLIDKDLSIAAKHSKLKGLLNSISISGGLDNPLVEVEYRGRQSNVILTTQGESTLKILRIKRNCCDISNLGLISCPLALLLCVKDCLIFISF
jgi:hypothetical protein